MIRFHPCWFIRATVSSAGRKYYRGSGVDCPVDRVHFNGRIMNVDNAVDSSRHGFAQIILFRLPHSILLQQRRIGRIEWNNDAALNDRLRRIRSIVGRPRMRYPERRGNWSKFSWCSKRLRN